MAGELGPSEREAAARDRAEMQVLQAELAGLLHKLQQQKTAVCTAQHQVQSSLMLSCMQPSHTTSKHSPSASTVDTFLHGSVVTATFML